MLPLPHPRTLPSFHLEYSKAAASLCVDGMAGLGGYLNHPFLLILLPEPPSCAGHGEAAAAPARGMSPPQSLTFPTLPGSLLTWELCGEALGKLSLRSSHSGVRWAPRVGCEPLFVQCSQRACVSSSGWQKSVLLRDGHV